MEQPTFWKASSWSPVCRGAASLSQQSWGYPPCHPEWSTALCITATADQHSTAWGGCQVSPGSQWLHRMLSRPSHPEHCRSGPATCRHTQKVWHHSDVHRLASLTQRQSQNRLPAAGCSCTSRATVQGSLCSAGKTGQLSPCMLCERQMYPPQEWAQLGWQPPELQAGQGIAHDAKGLQRLRLGPPGNDVAHVDVHQAPGHIRDGLRCHLSSVPAKALRAQLYLRQRAGIATPLEQHSCNQLPVVTGAVVGSYHCQMADRFPSSCWHTFAPCNGTKWTILKSSAWEWGASAQLPAPLLTDCGARLDRKVQLQTRRATTHNLTLLPSRIHSDSQQCNRLLSP